MSVQTTIQKVELQPYQTDFQTDLLKSLQTYMDSPKEVIDYASYIADRPELLTQAEN